MADLSPQAHEILKAAYKATRNPRWQTNFYSSYAAAILRTAADQVVPDGPKPNANSAFHLMNWTQSLDQYYQRQQTRDELLAIAAELEGNGQ